MKRLDEMDLNEVCLIYKEIFKNLITLEDFILIKNNIDSVYNKYLIHISEPKNYKIKGGTLGRGELKWGRNIIWGWFIENLLFKVFDRNTNIGSIEFFGGDSSQEFIYDDEKEEISITGRKTTEPDFLIKLNDGKDFLIELKTAAKGIFTIKKGNIEQLYKGSAYENRITLILMIDLENRLYGLENLKYFNEIQPFINQRMEGQLCYNFPAPEEEIEKLKTENFEDYLDATIFNLDQIKKLKILKKAEDAKNKRFIKIIKNKLRLERLEEEKTIKINDFDQKIYNLKIKCPEVAMSWNDIERSI